jgi:hypothetical protein
MKSMLLLPLLLIGALQVFAVEPVLKFTITKADGTPAMYEFFVPSVETNQDVAVQAMSAGAQQQRAGVAAMAWAKQFYGAHKVYLRSVELKQTGPVPYYLATFDGELAGARQTFFAVVLRSGAVVQPMEVARGASQ